jgi:hypothetical protein
MNEIKDNSFVVSTNKSPDATTITIADGTKLAKVFKRLPNGIVIKDETGMGATYLELTSPRPSIIVEPLKYTASSKAHAHGAIYFGSKTMHNKKPSEKELFAQLSSRPRKKRKIVVVADSLPQLKDILNDSFKDYFLLIDEADSFQLDSTFRDSMGDCFDIYKTHPEKIRALVTATPLAFSDEDLQSERKTIIKYDSPRKRPIKLIHCQNVNGTIVEVLRQIRQNDSKNKLMIAFNSLSGCIEIAKFLVKNESYEQDDISILCSASTASRSRAGLFFHELGNDVLPSAVNLVTSAYFTGFDLNDSYHLISVSDSKNAVFLLSDHRLKQIAGRCRRDLLSETVIYSTTLSQINIPKKDAMVKAAKVELKALDCIRSNFEDTPLLQANLSSIRKYIMEYTQDYGAQFLRLNVNGIDAVNYLSIDASLERYRVKSSLYQYREQLYDVLTAQGHNVSLVSKDSTVVTGDVTAQTDGSATSKKALVNDIIDGILLAEPAQLIDELRTNLGLSHLERRLIKTYLEHQPYIEKEGVVRILSSLGIRDDKQFKRLDHSAFFFSLPDDDIFKSRAMQLFAVGTSYSREQLFDIWNRIFTETGMAMNRKTFTLVKVVQFTNIHFKTTKDRATKGATKGGALPIKIIGINPDGFKLIKHQEQQKDKGKMNEYYS